MRIECKTCEGTGYRIHSGGGRVRRTYCDDCKGRSYKEVMCPACGDNSVGTPEGVCPKCNPASSAMAQQELDMASAWETFVLREEISPEDRQLRRVSDLEQLKAIFEAGYIAGRNHGRL